MTPAFVGEHGRAEQARSSPDSLTGDERKTVTALFADLKGSTAMIEGLDPEKACALIDPALQLMMDAVHRYEGYVAALFNLMRNIGGSRGIALAVTLLSRRAQGHQHILVEHVSVYNPEAIERLRLLWQGLMFRGVDSATAQEQAGHLIYGEVQRQALMMAFLDDFWLIGCIALACLPLIMLMRKSTQTAAVGGH